MLVPRRSAILARADPSGPPRSRCTASTAAHRSKWLPCRSEEHTSELQSRENLVCRLLLEKKKTVPSSNDWRQRVLRRLGSKGAAAILLVAAGASVSGGCGRTAVKAAPKVVFFFNDTATTEIYTLSLHDALPISRGRRDLRGCAPVGVPSRRSPSFL